MPFKSIVRELRGMKDGAGGISRKGSEDKNWLNRNRSCIAPDLAASEPMRQGQWANLPPELLLHIIRRVEESETAWPARAVVVSCASVCRTWRDITKEVVKTPEECGRLTFPISLKQPGPRDAPIQCYIKRNRASSTYRLYYGLSPSEGENDKLLLIAKKIRRATSTDFIISLVADDFSRVSHVYMGKLRSNFMGTKFTIYDGQPPSNAAVGPNSRQSRRFRTKQVSPRLPAYNYAISSISYELNVLRTRGPRKMNCVMHTIPATSIQAGATAPTPTSISQSVDERTLRTPATHFSPSFQVSKPESSEALVLRNKAPRWHEQLQCWCLNFKGRVTVASVKNFQLAATVEQEKVILQFGKIGKDMFTMDYRYPLSAFQSFAICLSSFDTKPACE